MTGNTGLMYVNGSSVTFSNLGSAATGIATYTGNASIAARGAAGFPFSGDMDELRISSVVRGADWITQTYNSQHSSMSFYSLSTPTSAPTGSLFLPAPLAGVGTGGPFFTNPLN